MREILIFIIEGMELYLKLVVGFTMWTFILAIAVWLLGKIGGLLYVFREKNKDTL